MSSRPDSTMARRMLRPMRPNPLMAMRTAMTYPFLVAPGIAPGADFIEARAELVQAGAGPRIESFLKLVIDGLRFRCSAESRRRLPPLPVRLQLSACTAF